MNIWEKLYNEAKKFHNNRQVSPFIDAGGVSCAILTKNNNIYVGVCIDTACSLGMCAERNAISSMITNNEKEITKIVIIMPNNELGLPCGACCELLMQLDKNSSNIEFLLDLNSNKTITLKELLPNWWGYNRFNELFKDVDLMNFAIAVKCLIKNENNKYLLLEKTKEEAKDDKSNSLYDIPGGRVKYGEDILDAILRETFEETGITLLKENIDKILNATSIIRKDGLHLVIITYVVNVKNPNIKLSKEHNNFYWIDENFNNLPSWILDTINLSKN